MIQRSAGLPDDNAKVNELLFRRVALEDVVTAHLQAAERATASGFSRYIVSAASPFSPDDLSHLRADAPGATRERIPGYEAEYGRRGWRMFPAIDRVYVNARARRELGWEPEWDFRGALARLRRDEDWRSPLARLVGSKGYHVERFADGPYPVDTPSGG